MKGVCVLLLCVLAVAAAKPSKLTVVANPSLESLADNQASANGMCPLCVNVMQQGIQQLLNVILNGGVVKGCSTLCASLAPKGKAIQYGCNILCDVVGIKAFIAEIKKADLDPIWLCQSIKSCPVNDCSADVCGSVTSSAVAPASGIVGTKFQVSAQVQIMSNTGTGEISFAITEPRGGVVYSNSLVADGWKKDSPYNFQLDIDTTESPDDDVYFDAGKYVVDISVCQGSCSSHHAHAKVLATAQTSFELTTAQDKVTYL
eukprot:GILJ01000268.1.p1 GENE.GILJ01000268.1~~GILJ01000268.1.p1  ORF type:complete len:277 (+),score=33.99 GILJ01000268.1:54-833(+)